MRHEPVRLVCFLRGSFFKPPVDALGSCSAVILIFLTTTSKLISWNRREGDVDEVPIGPKMRLDFRRKHCVDDFGRAERRRRRCHVIVDVVVIVFSSVVGTMLDIYFYFKRLTFCPPGS